MTLGYSGLAGRRLRAPLYYCTIVPLCWVPCIIAPLCQLPCTIVPLYLVPGSIPKTCWKMMPKWKEHGAKMNQHSSQNRKKMKPTWTKIQSKIRKLGPRSVLNGKWCPERFQDAPGNSVPDPVGVPLARKWWPEGRQWDPLGVENGIKNRKMSVKKQL